MSKKPSWHHINYPALKELLGELELPYEEFNEHHFRIMGATHIIDIWPARMTYHLHNGETIKAKEPYYRGELDQEFNKEQVTRLLETGALKDEKFLDMATAMANLADSLIKQLLPALSTIGKWYSDLPEEVKLEIAKRQVEDDNGSKKT